MMKVPLTKTIKLGHFQQRFLWRLSAACQAKVICKQLAAALPQSGRQLVLELFYEVSAVPLQSLVRKWPISVVVSQLPP